MKPSNQTGKKVKAKTESLTEGELNSIINQSKILIWKSDSEGSFTYLNSEWLKYRGRSLEQEVGCGWMEGIHPDDLENFKNNYFTHLNSRSSIEAEFRLARYDGDYRWMLFRGGPNTGLSEKNESYIGCCTDITKNKLTLFDNLIDEVHVWKVIKDEYGEIESWKLVDANERALAAWKKTRDEVVGKSTNEIFGYDATKKFKPIVKKIMMTGNPFTWETYFSPTKQHLFMNSVPLGDFFISTGRDISEIKATQDELKKAKERAEASENRLMIASKAAQLGIWDWNVKDNVLIWDDRMYEMYGVNRESSANTFDLWANSLHPEDKEKVVQEVSDAIEGKSVFDTAFRIVRPDKEVLHIKGDGLVLRDEKGKAVRMIGINRDITDAAIRDLELQKAKAESERREFELKEAQKIAKVGSWYLDISSNEVTWSEELYNMYGFDPKKPVPPYTEHMKLFTEESWNILASELAQTAEKGVPYELELETIRNGKRNGWMWVKGEAVFNDNQIIGLRGAAQDITDLKLNELKLKETLKEKERLFQELHHRIKNNLHMVSSLMYTKSILSSDHNLNEFINESISRINSIAKIHDTLLHLEEFDNLNTGKYLVGLVTDVINTLAFDASKYPVELDIADFQLQVDDILALGLITNESISNILKHAYDPKIGGKIMVSFQKKDNNYVLLIKDYGRGMKGGVSNSHKSVGLLMIDQLSKQLKGSINRTTENGTSFELIFPAEV